jgi:WD40 repeat protein
LIRALLMLLFDAMLISGQVLKRFRLHSSYVKSVAFSPDGLLLAMGSGDKTVSVVHTGTWGVATPFGRNLRRLHLDAIFSVAFSPCGRWCGKARNVQLT